MNYLLVMPRLVETIGDGYNFPLGIAYISGAMKRAGFNVQTLNLNHHAGKVIDLMRAEIEAHDIGAVACGGLSFQFWTVEEVLRSAKEINPKIITISGGGLVSADPEATMEALVYADIGVIGEGEETIVELCHTINKGDDISDVHGIIHQGGRTPARGYIKDIDTLAWPDYEGFEMEEYFKMSPSFAGMNSKNTVFMLSSRSCTHLCTFCFHGMGTKYRVRSLDCFFEELDWLVSKYPIEIISISDELFCDDFDRVKEFCARIKKYNIRWWAQFRVDNITPELVDVLKDGNCANMTFGIESADDDVLKSMHKNTTIEQVHKTLSMVYEKGVSMTGALIFGDIAETREKAQKSIDYALEHPEFNIAMAMIQTFPGTHIYRYAIKKGIIKDRVKFLRDGCPQVNISKMSDAEFAEVINIVQNVQLNNTNILENMETSNINYKTARIDVSGNCSHCHKLNEWTDIKLFRTYSFSTCRYCGTKHNTMLPDQQREDVGYNIERLVKKYGKVAIWGMNYQAVDVIPNILTLLVR